MVCPFRSGGSGLIDESAILAGTTSVVTAAHYVGALNCNEYASRWRPGPVVFVEHTKGEHEPVNRQANRSPQGLPVPHHSFHTPKHFPNQRNKP